eukprot:7387593-Prymnesium_polylepis.3
MGCSVDHEQRHPSCARASAQTVWVCVGVRTGPAESEGAAQVRAMARASAQSMWVCVGVRTGPAESEGAAQVRAMARAWGPRSTCRVLPVVHTHFSTVCSPLHRFHHSRMLSCVRLSSAANLPMVGSGPAYSPIAGSGGKP